jgi:Immunity protein 32
VITLEYDNDNEYPEAVELVCDRAGLEELLQQLRWLHDQPPPEHFHLFTPSWAGHELSEEPQREGTRICHHLKVTLLPS